MKQTLIVTDLTRMREPRVCLAGYLPDMTCVRPLFRHRDVTEPWLWRGGELVVRPFAVVELDLIDPQPRPPHTEDWRVDARYRREHGVLSTEDRLALLRDIEDDSVAAIYQAPIERHPGASIAAGTGTRSLGTIAVDHVGTVCYREREPGAWDYRLSFRDRTRQTYDLAVTDLAFRAFLDWLRTDGDVPAIVAAQRLTATLRAADRLSLRLGLTRGEWDKHLGRCFLQVTGVYSFPDYLDGRCYADFAPPPPEPVLNLANVPF
jgi:hypothetical protein